jgi:uridine kinase
MRNKVIISICGGSGSGKTFLAIQLAERLGLDNAVRVPTDFYLKSRACLFPMSSVQHPLEYDWGLLDLALNEAAGVMISTPIGICIRRHWRRCCMNGNTLISNWMG